MNQQSAAVLQFPALYVPRVPRGLWAICACWESITLMARRHHNVALSLTLAASTLFAAPAHREDTNLGTAEDPRNETVVYRQGATPEPIVHQQSFEDQYTEQFEASDELDDDTLQTRYPRSVQVVRYVHLEGPIEIANVASTPGDSIRNEQLIKVGGFVAFRPKDDEGNTDERESSLRCEGNASHMETIDDYLWEVYQRVPIKKDGTGDFTWKDPAAAKHVGLCLKDYVIGGMDPEFREQLYRAGLALDSAGLQWSMLSAFRDDYRQSLAAGYKASVSNSLHGGSRRTGGYGHGRAIDITGPEGKESKVWKWIDAHGAKYGLHRPLPKADPAHVQQLGERRRTELASRDGRTDSATVHKGKSKVAASGAKAKPRKTAVASAR
jgi:hypothetical protein